VTEIENVDLRVGRLSLSALSTGEAIDDGSRWLELPETATLS
jgi:hypothetical protein